MLHSPSPTMYNPDSNPETNSIADSCLCWPLMHRCLAGAWCSHSGNLTQDSHHLWHSFHEERLWGDEAWNLRTRVMPAFCQNRCSVQIYLEFVHLEPRKHKISSMNCHESRFFRLPKLQEYKNPPCWPKRVPPPWSQWLPPSIYAFTTCPTFFYQIKSWISHFIFNCLLNHPDLLCTPKDNFCFLVPWHRILLNHQNGGPRLVSALLAVFFSGQDHCSHLQFAPNLNRVPDVSHWKPQGIYSPLTLNSNDFGNVHVKINLVP